jgi:hypothetical protein
VLLVLSFYFGNCVAKDKQHNGKKKTTAGQATQLPTEKDSRTNNTITNRKGKQNNTQRLLKEKQNHTQRLLKEKLFCW